MYRLIRISGLISAALFAATLAQGQRMDSYINDLSEALVPYGTITAPNGNCHNVEIELSGPWGDYGMVDGRRGTEPTFLILKINALRIFVDLANLDEDKGQTMALLSGEDIANHKGPWQAGELKGSRPAVFIAGSGLNNGMTVYTVDLKKLKALPEGKTVTESQMGVTLDSKRSVIILFSDKGHADAFDKAIKKAIVVCKAQ